jgi:hypothetical protein
VVDRADIVDMIRRFCNNPLVSTVSTICSEAINFVTHKEDQIDKYHRTEEMEEEKATTGIF